MPIASSRPSTKRTGSGGGGASASGGAGEGGRSVIKLKVKVKAPPPNHNSRRQLTTAAKVPPSPTCTSLFTFLHVPSACFCGNFLCPQRASGCCSCSSCTAAM